jgi:hypothetical protein
MRAGTFLFWIGIAVLALILYRAWQLMDPPPGAPLPGEKPRVVISTR